MAALFVCNMHRLTLLLLMLLIGARAQAAPAPVIHTREEYNNTTASYLLTPLTSSIP
jgi:hypothetical protein